MIPRHSIDSLDKRALLIILDGYGINPNRNKNAIYDAKKPHLDDYFTHYPFTTIEGGGELVGLPKGLAGNSEVGHMNLGAGRPVRQDLVRINEAIRQNTLKDMPKLLELIHHAQKGSKRIHLMGLLSDGGVHSHIDHLRALVDIFSTYPDLKIFLHAFTDGRDTARDVGVKYVQQALDFMKAPQFTFASMQGRSIGMDRDRRWPKIETAYKTMIGKGTVEPKSPVEYLKGEYAQGRYDEFVNPVLFDPSAAIRNGDSVFFMNFRPDRAIQLTLAMCWDKFTEFPVPVKPSYFLCMTPYVPDEIPDIPVLFDKEKLQGGLTDYISGLGLRQLKIAETEKYAHVTYFFNGGEKKPFPGEEHVLIPSPKDVSTYDKKPQMSEPEVTARLIEAIKARAFDLHVVNFANSDMVGHTGNYEAAVKAIETLDGCVGKLVEAANAQGMPVLITADHGNSDQMVYEDGTPHTSHTGAPVPLCIVHPALKDQKLTVAPGQHALKDVAPTILKVMGIKIPSGFEGKPIFN